MLLIRPGGIPDLASISDLWNAVWPHHQRGLQELLRDQEVLQPDCRPIFWIAEREGSIAGVAEANRNVASYHPKKWHFAISVLPSYRRQGIGGELYETMLSHLRNEGLISATTRVGDDDAGSIRFIAEREYKEVKRDFESELDLSTVRPELLKAMSETSVEIKPLSKLDSAEFRREFHEAFEVIRIDTPRAEPPTPLSFDQFQTLVIDDPEFLPEGSQIAIADGRIVGFSGIYASAVEGQIFQWLTGVKREYRGKDVAKALKAHAAQWAIANGYRTIRTDNDTRNAPMLSINDRMGFRRLPGMITFVKQFESESPESSGPSLESSA